MALESRELKGNHQETYDKLVESALLESPEVPNVLEQVETKPGLAWEEPKAEAPLGREPRFQSSVDEGPLVQVETNIPVGEATELPVLTDEVVPEVIPVGEVIETEFPILTDEIEDPNFSKIEEIKRGENNPFVGVTIEQGEEKTPKEWRDRLRGLIDSAKEKLNIGERGEQLKSFLSEHLKQLDHTLDIKGRFQKLGERYDNLPRWQKVTLGGSLAVGYGLTLPLSSWMAGAYGVSLFATRVAAMAGSFENNKKLLETINKEEKNGWLANTKLYKWLGSGSEENREKKAMMKALVQSFGMTAGISYAAHELAELHVAERIGQWMVEHISGKTTEIPNHIATGKVLESPAVLHSVTEALHIEMPSVEASQGHGTEFMMKRLWEQLQEKHISLPVSSNENSDLYKLLHADSNSIDKVVHDIASDPKHGFFTADGASARIGLGSHMTVDAEGNIKLDGALQTPSLSHAIFPEGQNPDIDDETRKRAMEFVTAHNPQEAVTAGVSVADETPLPVPVESVETIPTPIEHTVPVPVEHTVSAPIEHTVPLPEPEAEHLVDSSGTPVVDSEGNPIHSGAGEALSSINRFGIPVSSADPHLYLDVDRNIVFHGGSPEEKMRLITEYLTQHKGAVIYASDVEGHRVPWFQDIADKIQQGPPTRSKSFFGFGIFKFDTPPNPNDFKEILH